MDKLLSAIIVTFNEEKNIARCIDSMAGIADEIIVVDSFSQDNTVAIASAKGARVLQNIFVGYIEQKQFALSHTRHNYILSLDADEALDETLRAEIMRVRKSWTAGGYSCNRLNNYCGKWIRHGGWYPDVKLRLFDKTKGEWKGINPHDRFDIDPKEVVHLKGNILHYSYSSIGQHLQRSEKYARISAQAYRLQGKKHAFLKMLISPLFRFMRDYIFKLGFLDGYYGLVIAGITAREVFLKYRLLWKLNRQ